MSAFLREDLPRFAVAAAILELAALNPAPAAERCAERGKCEPATPPERAALPSAAAAASALSAVTHPAVSTVTGAGIVHVFKFSPSSRQSSS